MVFIINTKPVGIDRLQKRLQKQRDKEAKAMKIKRALEKGIQENPITKRNQFEID